MISSPEGNINSRAYLVVFHISFVADDFGKLAHCMDANDAFKSQVGLQAERASEIVG